MIILERFGIFDLVGEACTFQLLLILENSHVVAGKLIIPL